jgi:hypothetical protein
MKKLKETRSFKNVKFLAVFVAVLVVTAALIAGCLNPVPVPDGWDDLKPQPGKGAVRLVIGNSSARTILPDEYELEDFYRVEVKFNSATPSLVRTVQVSPIGNSAALNIDDLAIGSYTSVVATAYTAYTDPTTNKPAASATTATSNGGITGNLTVAATTDTDPIGTTGFTIADGDELELSVTLRLITPNGTDEGTLKYTVDLSGITRTINSATMTATKVGTGENPASPTSLNTAGPKTTDSSMTLKSGYYWLNFDITAAGSSSIKFRELVHIYQNMQSTLNRTFTEDHLYVPIVTPPTGGSTGSITYEDPKEKFPSSITVEVETGLRDGGNGTSEATAIILSLTESEVDDDVFEPNSVSLKITNPGSMADIVWWAFGFLLGDDTDTIVISTDEEPFDVPIVIPISVSGRVDGTMYDAIIYVKIIP